MRTTVCTTHARDAERSVAREHDAEPVAGLQTAPLVVAHPRGELVAVPHPRVRRHDHPSAGDLRAPAQAHVVEEVADPLVEATDLREQVGAHQGARARHREHVADRVVLRLVELAPLDERHAVPGVVHALTDLEQPLRVVPVDELRPDDGGVGPEGLLDEDPHDVGLRGDVVVAEQVEGRPVDDLDHLVGGGSEARVLLEAAHERAGRRRCPPVASPARRCWRR